MKYQKYELTKRKKKEDKQQKLNACEDVTVCQC